MKHLVLLLHPCFRPKWVDIVDRFLMWLFPRKRKRLEMRFLSYAEADKLIRDTNGAWTIAKEEDTNRYLDMVYLERLEP